MRNHFGLSILFAAALIISLVMLGGITPRSRAAQAKAVDPHDLSGIWEAPVMVSTGVAGGKGTAPFTPLGRREFDANKPFTGPRIVPVGQSNDPMIKCDPLGFPRNVFYEIRHMKFVQTPTETVQLLQYQAIWREIWTDGRKLPTNVGQSGGPDPRWYGYSVGRWDGNTFVVNTVGLDDRSWVDAYGDPHSSDLRVEERYTRQDAGHLKFNVTLEDPQVYSKSFVALAEPGLIFTSATKLGVAGQLAWGDKLELPEQMCVPSEAANYYSLVAAPANGKTASDSK